MGFLVSERKNLLSYLSPQTQQRDPLMEYLFKLNDKVRDYECDLQGIVNNSVYQNYLEHARHEFLYASGINFAKLASEGVFLVVTRAELNYKTPLKSGDSYWIGLRLSRSSKIRFDFYQDIYRASDNKLAVSAKVTGTCLNERGRPGALPELDQLISNITSSTTFKE